MPPSDGGAPAVKAFTDALWQVWIKAGPTTYAAFEQLSKEVLGPADYLARSTVEGNLKHRGRRRPPQWEWVLRFWAVLQALAAKHHIDPDSLGSLEDLKRLHGAAYQEALLARQQAGAPGTGAAATPLPDADPGDAAPEVAGIPCTQAFPDASAQCDEMLASIRRRVGDEWWHEYRDVVPGWFEAYLSLEATASLIQIYDNAVVPALFQTEAYARAALHLEPFALSEATVDRMIGLRMHRQQTLRTPSAPRLWVILDESAIRYQLGDAQVMRGQLARLIGISSQRNVTIQVIPAAPGIRSTLSYPFTLLRSRVHEVPDIAYFEAITDGFYRHESADVRLYAQVFEVLADEALPPAETVAYLRRLHQEL